MEFRSLGEAAFWADKACFLVRFQRVARAEDAGGVRGIC